MENKMDVQNGDMQEVFSKREMEFKPVIEAQLEAGVLEPFRSWDFYKGAEITEPAAEVFFRFLNNGIIVDPVLKEGMVRSLGVSHAYRYFDSFVKMYRAEEPDRAEPNNFGVKGGLAAVISEHVLRHKEREGKLFDLISDDSNGLSRIVFLSQVLRRSNSLLAHETIREVALHSKDQKLKLRLHNADWKSYWKKHDPALHAKWYPAKVKSKKE